ncbi:MAG: VirB3 family type IV secretion system protein [Flavobacteriales bacterium]|nr:VirB3 family type IV secretion system protein [Flavobacteriales bacterium]
MIKEDILFLGLTRPAMIAGVPYDAVVGIAVCNLIVFIGFKDLKMLLLYPALHGICYLVTKHDPNTFRLLKMWFITKSRSLNRFYWKASSSGPFINTRVRGRRKRTWL